MNRRTIPQSRAERLIAGGRLALALASFGAIYFDPLEPSRFPAIGYSLLAAYAIYALAIAIWTTAAQSTSFRRQLVSHLIDLMFFGAINYMTFGPTSPFFVYFIFSIICAMLRFGRRGTIMTAAAALVVFIASGAARVPTAQFELNRFIIRAAYLVVVAWMLVYLAAYHERIQRDLARIARWPRTTRRSHAELVSNLMRESASIFGARRVLLAYEYLSERFAYLGAWQDEDFEVSVEAPPTADSLLDHEAGTYVSSSALQAAPIDFDDSAAMTRRRVNHREAERSLPAEVVREYGIVAVVATPFKGEFVRGRLLLLDGALPLLEEINLAKIAGAVIAGRLDHFHAALQLQRGAVAEERVRVARDLHDSVLQSLTGVALQLHTLPRLMMQNPDEAVRRLGEVEQVIVSGQKELRWFIDELRPQRTRLGENLDDLDERLTQLARRFREQWAIEVENEVSPVVHLLPIGMRYEVYAIVNEAVANAAKHAAAKRISVAIDVEDGHVHVDVNDDGRGFPFHGRYDLQTLVASNRGPVTLKERVSALHGSMVIDSSDAGARIAIRVPLASTGV
jgi:signal transduction histidine kinase